MDHRCPKCAGSLAKRKLTQAIVTRMEIDCSHCKNRIQLNVHPSEILVVLVLFSAFVALALLAYWFKSQEWMLAAIAVAMVGTIALPVLESTYLRSWPRYLIK